MQEPWVSASAYPTPMQFVWMACLDACLRFAHPRNEVGGGDIEEVHRTLPSFCRFTWGVGSFLFRLEKFKEYQGIGEIYWHISNIKSCYLCHDTRPALC